MEDFTITDLQQLLFTIASIIGSLIVLAGYIKKWLGADIQEISQKQRELDKQQTMDFLVMEFARAERHELTEGEKIHLKKRYDHYTQKPEEGGLGGNSYIKDQYESLKKNGKL